MPTSPEAGRAAPFLSAKEVTAGYKKVPVVRGLSVQVAQRETVLIIGPNGAGKSTLVKAITGKLPLLGGSVVLGGEDISSLREEQRAARGIGYVPQSGDVFPTLTVYENLEMGAYQVPRRDVRARIDEVFEVLPTLAALRRRPARALSGGERKTLGIARALVARPRLLILDEPTSNLSPQIASSVMRHVVASLACSGVAVLLIEQRVKLGLEVADWGYVLAEGALRLSASGDVLRGHEDLAGLFLAAGARQDVPAVFRR